MPLSTDVDQALSFNNSVVLGARSSVAGSDGSASPPPGLDGDSSWSARRPLRMHACFPTYPRGPSGVCCMPATLNARSLQCMQVFAVHASIVVLLWCYFRVVGRFHPFSPMASMSSMSTMRSESEAQGLAPVRAGKSRSTGTIAAGPEGHSPQAPTGAVPGR
jgi:hypothetical protein